MIPYKYSAAILSEKILSSPRGRAPELRVEMGRKSLPGRVGNRLKPTFW